MVVDGVHHLSKYVLGESEKFAKMYRKNLLSCNSIEKLEHDMEAIVRHIFVIRSRNVYWDNVREQDKDLFEELISVMEA